MKHGIKTVLNNMSEATFNHGNVWVPMHTLSLKQ